MILTRDKGSRMWGGQGGGTGGSGGGGGIDMSALAGYATEMWVEEGYISKAFWTELFVIHGTETVYISDDDGATWTQDGDPTSIIFSPNEIPSEVIVDGETAGTKTKTVRAITSIEAKKGVWTNFYLSALGQNSGGGGGGGGSSTLQGLLDVNIPATLTQANDGQVLMYNYAQNKWINANVVTSVAAGTGLTTNVSGSGAITSIGTISISATYQTYIGHGETAYGWGNHANAGYAQASALSNYLPLMGGTMSNTNLVTNMNADLLDGMHIVVAGTNSVAGIYGNRIPYIGSDYVMEVGRYIDFHKENGAGDYATRIQLSIDENGNTYNNTVTLPSATGKLALISDITTALNGYATQQWVGQNYLSLSGGTMANTNLVTNMNADRLDGFHANDMLVHYGFPRNSTGSNYWHKLGEYETGGDSSNLIIEIYSGAGYNGLGLQNTWAKIIIKDGWQEMQSAINSVGVSVEQFGYYGYGDLKVIVVATAHNRGAVWVQLPWQWAVGDYVVYGRYTSWTHNDSIESDTTTAPTSNQEPVYYYRNLSYLNTEGQEAVTLPHDFSVKAGVDGAQLRIGNMLLSYDSTNKALKIEHQGSNGVEAGNIYATGGVSSLGQNSGGGGGGGSSTLAGLNDVQLGTLSADDILIYDGTGHWINTSKSSFLNGYLTSVAFSDLTSHPTTLSGYGITDAYISGGTIYLGSNSITPLTSFTETDPTVPSWAKQPTKPSYSFSELTSHPTTLSGYGITDAYISGGTIYLGSNSITPLTSFTETDPTVPSWAKQPTKPSYSFSELTYHPTTLSGYGITDAVNSSTTWWGQSVSNGVVSGSITNVGNITSNTNGSIYSFSAIEFGTASNSGNGGALYFHFPGVFGHASSYIIEQSEGVLSLLGTPPTGGNFGVVVGNANGTYLQIGNIQLVYDATNNALKVQKSDGTAGNFYATGAVSALGANTGSGGGGSSGIYENLTVSDTLSFVKSGYTSRIYGDSYGYLHIDGDEYIVMNNDVTMNGYSIYNANDIHADRFYVGVNRYIYLDGNNVLKYYDNGTVKTINLT